MKSRKSADLSADIFDISVTRGDAWSQRIKITGPDGAPLDLTDYTITAQVRPTPDSSEFTPINISPTDLVNGIFHIGQDVVTPGFYDVQLVPLDGLRRTYVSGRITIIKDVTRP